jgi:glycosyltransferase involved in cell wall biosynthesis
MAHPATRFDSGLRPAAIATVPVARVPLTVVIPTLNAAAHLAEALQSVWFADEVIVIDAGSRDDTIAIARAHGARLLSVMQSTIGAQRNAGIATARNQWVLALDADEVVTPELRQSLALLCASDGPPRAYRVRSRNWHLGQELRYGPWGRDWKLRVFPREARFNLARVHENLESPGDTGRLPGALLHRPYQDLAHQVEKIAQYARWAATDMRARGRRASLIDVLGRPVWRFVRDYVVYSGWRDGRAGYVAAAMSAFSVFLKYGSLWFAGDATAPPP